jgi:hypothetical protein
MVNGMKKIFFLIIALLALVSCKPKQQLVSVTGKVSDAELVDEVIHKHLNTVPSFSTLSGSVMASYSENEEDKQSMPFSLRMEKGKTIWLSAPLGVAKALITPEKLSFYNRWDNTAFSGDFSYLAELLGFSVGFGEVQNLLLGNLLYSVSADVKLLPTDDNRYVLQTNNGVFTAVYRLLPDSYRVESTLLLHNEKQQRALISYTYQKVTDELLPATISIEVVNEDNRNDIVLELKSLELNGQVSFPFKMPE